jgi:hypothetical protein
LKCITACCTHPAGRQRLRECRRQSCNVHRGVRESRGQQLGARNVITRS